MLTLAGLCFAAVVASAAFSFSGRPGPGQPSPKRDAVRHHRASFEVRGTNGYRGVFSLSAGYAEITVFKDHTASLYSTYRSRVEGNRFRARFGAFGAVSVDFLDESNAVRHASVPACNESAAIGGRSGTFVGRIRFRGESGYTSVSVKKASGSVINSAARLSGRCNKPLTGKSESNHQEIGLQVGGSAARDGFVLFKAGKDALAGIEGWETEIGVPLGLKEIDRRGVAFSALAVEKVAGVHVTRLAAASGPKGSLALRGSGNEMSIVAPAPFIGTAVYTPCKLERWRGSLRIDFAGARDVVTRNPLADQMLPRPACTS